MFRMPCSGVFVLNALLQQHLVGQCFIVMVHEIAARVPNVMGSDGNIISLSRSDS